MRISLLILFLLSIVNSRANMASPVQNGTMTASVFTSKDMDILHERILLKVDRWFKTAHYEIEYKVRTNNEVNQLPLLFYAREFLRDFRVWVDGKEMILLGDSSTTRNEAESFYKRFKEQYAVKDNSGCFRMIYGKGDANRCINISDLKYFETPLSVGEHVIHVEYVGRVWVDLSEWIQHKSFRYSLSPAKYWKSFGSLDLIIDATECDKKITCNIDNKNRMLGGKITTFHFDSLPAENLELEFTPKISSNAKFWLWIGPGFLALIFSFILLLLHIFLTDKAINWQWKYGYGVVLVIGSFIMSVVFTLSYSWAEQFIDYTIGADASRYHGYSFLRVIFVPLIWPIYGAIVHQLLKYKLRSKRAKLKLY